jgi:hypothetical protein
MRLSVINAMTKRNKCIPLYNPKRCQNDLDEFFYTRRKIMPTYQIAQYETHTQGYTVEADNPKEALQKIMDGEGDIIEGSLEYCEVDDTKGMPVEEFFEEFDLELDDENYQDIPFEGNDEYLETIASIKEFKPEKEENHAP